MFSAEYFIFYENSCNFASIMRRFIIIIALLLGITIEGGAVLKEKNLEETLTILRSELTKHYHET